MIMNITFRRKPWKFSKIYVIEGGVDEGVEDLRVYQSIVLVKKMHLLQINYFSLGIWKWAKALTAIMLSRKLGPIHLTLDVLIDSGKVDI